MASPERFASLVAYPRDHAIGVIEGAFELLQIRVPLSARQATLEHPAHLAHSGNVLAISGTPLVFRRVRNAVEVQNRLDQGDIGRAELAQASGRRSLRRKGAQQASGNDGNPLCRGTPAVLFHSLHDVRFIFGLSVVKQ
jgi:hypothetical protein